jgi:Trypsin-like peptidase domain
MNRFFSVLVFLVIEFMGTNEAVSQQLSNAEKVERSVVMLARQSPKPENVIGSGFWVFESGLIMTADHVVLDEKTGLVHEPLFAIRSVGPELHTFRMRVVRRFNIAGGKGRDLALLEPSEPPKFKLEPLQVGNPLKVGEHIIIGGFPLVWDQVKKFPLIRRGSIASTQYESDGASILVLGLPSVPGFSGSPVVQTDTGLVVGVLSRAPKSPGSGFSVVYVVTTADLSLEKKMPSK